MEPLHESVKKKEILREMSFLEHLEELRGVLLHSIVAFAIGTAGFWFVSGWLLDFLVSGLPVEQLNFFAPSEAFMTRLRLSAVFGFVVAFPYILARVWAYISPGLFRDERKRMLPIIVSSSALFYAGVIFCYQVMIPIVVDFLLGFQTERLAPMISVNAYFTMVARLCLTFGLVFQLPVVVLLLAIAGLVTPRFLLKQWRYAVVVVFIAAAILTPPDPASQVLMALPILLLYILSVLMAMVVVRRKARDAKDEMNSGRTFDQENH